MVCERQVLVNRPQTDLLLGNHMLPGGRLKLGTGTHTNAVPHLTLEWYQVGRKRTAARVGVRRLTAPWVVLYAQVFQRWIG